MRVLSDQTSVGRHADRQGRSAPQRAGSWPWSGWLEGLAVLVSPAVVALVLRLRLMAPIDVPDPAMHTTYIVDPRDVFVRYAVAYANSARLREGARVGFLVPARLAYLLFGAVPGFIVMRYVLALIAIVPVYLLLRRLYGRPAGVAGVLIVLSSPVFVTAWGTDYPDSAVISYAACGLACLAMPCSPRWRRAWLAAGGAALTTAVWSHGVAVLLVGATIAAYLAVRLLRQRASLIGDIALLAGVAVAVTGILVVASAAVLGHADYLKLTWQSYTFLSGSGQTAQWHSANWHWVTYIAYLLVPPAVLAAFAVTFWRRWRTMPTPVLVVGVAAAAQLLAYTYFQFFGTIESLEEHYFSSTLWAGVCLTLAVTVAELARPLSERPVLRWLPPALLLVVPLAYEADPHVPAFGLAGVGLVVGLILTGGAAVGRLAARLGPTAAVTGIALGITVLVGGVLVLTVAPIPAHAPLRNTAAKDDPAPAYATALGGSSAEYVANYRIATELPSFVGPATYNREEVLIWWPRTNGGFPNREYAGMYHGDFNSLPSSPPTLTTADQLMLQRRRPAEILLYSNSAASFPAALRSLANFQPTLVRSATLRSQPLVLHAWLVRLGLYYHHPGRLPRAERPHHQS
ncbi:MAG TPA: glycosyltransferase family 39 protein [Streptosporangiaceae bacterium]|jgi:hypothetical protein